MFVISLITHNLLKRVVILYCMVNEKEFLSQTCVILCGVVVAVLQISFKRTLLTIIYLHMYNANIHSTENCIKQQSVIFNYAMHFRISSKL